MSSGELDEFERRRLAGGVNDEAWAMAQVLGGLWRVPGGDVNWREGAEAYRASVERDGVSGVAGGVDDVLCGEVSEALGERDARLFWQVWDGRLRRAVREVQRKERFWVWVAGASLLLNGLFLGLHFWLG